MTQGMSPPTGFDALHELAGEADRMSRVLGAALDPAATFEGHDETENVYAVVDADGAVTDFRLEREWYDEIDSRKLGAAVLEAVNAAGVARLSTWAEKVAEAEANEPAANTPAPPAPVPAGPFDINPSGEMVDKLLSLLHRAGTEAQAEAKTAAAAAQAKPRPTKGVSDGGHITVLLDGQQPVEVRVETDTRWVGTANNLEIVSELRSAFVAAYRAAEEAAPRRRSTSAITELQALTADPQEFIAKLFGIQPR